MAEAEASSPKRLRRDKTPERVIIDTDPGVDDFWALCLALASPEEVDVLGVTIVWGNGKDMNVLARNACAAVHLCGRSDIKVVKGAQEPIVGLADASALPESAGMVHGANGLGDVQLPDWAFSAAPLDHHHDSAAQFMAETCASRPGEVTLVTLGPLTNVADALRLSPSFARDVKRIVMMGGSVQGGQFGTFGNRTSSAEANIAADPEAAKFVFARFPRITMAGLNVTYQLDCELWANRVKGVNEAGRLLHAISMNYVAVCTGRPGCPPAGLHDPCAMLAVLRPDLFVKEAQVCVDVETKGELTRGETVADWREKWKRLPQTTVLMQIDSERALEFSIERISRLRFPDLGDLTRTA